MEALSRQFGSKVSFLFKMGVEGDIMEEIVFVCPKSFRSGHVSVRKWLWMRFWLFWLAWFDLESNSLLFLGKRSSVCLTLRFLHSTEYGLFRIENEYIKSNCFLFVSAHIDDSLYCKHVQGGHGTVFLLLQNRRHQQQDYSLSLFDSLVFSAPCPCSSDSSNTTQ